MRKLCFSGLLVAFYFGFAPGARAELSQADITAAINAAIIVPKVNNNGQIFQTALYRGSSSIASLQYQTNLELGRFKQAVLEALAAITNAPSGGVGSSAWTTNDVAALRDTLAALQQAITGFDYPDINAAVWDIQSGLSYWNDVVFRGWSEEFFDQVRFDENRLIVHDQDVDNTLALIQEDMNEGFSDLKSESNSGFASIVQALGGVDLSTLEGYSKVISDQTLAEQAADDDTQSTVDASERAAESDYQSTVEEATSDYEEIPLPGISDSYQPTPSESDLQGEDLGLSDIEDPGDHNALIRLTRRGEFLPEVEVDFGQNSELINGVNRFHDLFAYLYPVLFGILFSLKGIHMWRVVQTASTAGAVGVDPIVHLSWSPF